MQTNIWYIAHVIIVFSKLKGQVKTESGRKMVYPGEWFMPLVESPKGRWISSYTPSNGLAHPATEEEIKNHFNK